jgi:hypothetical protein
MRLILPSLMKNYSRLFNIIESHIFAEIFNIVWLILAFILQKVRKLEAKCASLEKRVRRNMRKFELFVQQIMYNFFFKLNEID